MRQCDDWELEEENDHFFWKTFPLHSLFPTLKYLSRRPDHHPAPGIPVHPFFGWNPTPSVWLHDTGQFLIKIRILQSTFPIIKLYITCSKVQRWNVPFYCCFLRFSMQLHFQGVVVSSAIRLVMNWEKVLLLMHNGQWLVERKHFENSGVHIISKWLDDLELEVISCKILECHSSAVGVMKIKPLLFVFYRM